MASFKNLILSLFALHLVSGNAVTSPQILFGPKVYRGQLFSPRAQTSSFNVANPALAPGRLVIKNGVGAVPLPKVCPKPNLKNLLSVLACKLDNAFRIVKAKITQVDKLEITFNGQTVVSENHFDNITSQLILSVEFQSSNKISVKAQGLPTSYVTIQVDRLSTANQAPIAAFSTTPGPVTDPLSYKFDGSTSSDPDGSIAAWAFDFGEGQVGSGAVVSHKFATVGTYKVTLMVTDNKGAQNSVVSTIVVQDLRPPVLSITAPVEGSMVPAGSLAVSGSSDEPLVSVTANGQVLALSTDHRAFSGSVQISGSGSVAISFAAIDESGNQQTAVRHVNILINHAPVPKFTISGSSGIKPFRVYFDGSKSSDPDGDRVSYNWSFGDGKTEVGPIVTHEFLSTGEFTVELKVTDSKGASASITSQVSVSDPVLPPDPMTLAPQLQPALYTSLADQISFLYQGANPIQKGLLAGALDAKRPGLVRGRVLDQAGQPLSGVIVSVLGSSQFGSSTSRTDGYFDLALNAGETITLNFDRSGYLTVQRNIEVIAQSGQVVADVMMLRPDSKVTSVAMASTAAQFASGNVVQDASGSRTSTVLFPSGLSATAVLASGGSVNLSTLSFRATEYTVGADGPSRMPGQLPKTSAYTFAVDLTSDEGLALGASKITFSKPVSFYVENFLNLPVGTAVPVGSYDRNQGLWLPEPDGVVIKILNVANGSASVDVTGSGQAASASVLQDWDITSEELQSLGSKYAVGATLWRTQMNHFTSFDMNFADADRKGDKPTLAQKPKCPCIPGSGNLLLAGGPMDQGGPEGAGILGCEINPFLRLYREDISLAGVPAYLSYASNRQVGFLEANSYEMKLITGSVPTGLISVEVNTSVAGRKYKEILTPQDDLNYHFSRWDGKDAYGRSLTSPTRAKVELKFNYPEQYLACPAKAKGTSSFGQPGRPACQVFQTNRTTDTYFYPFTVLIGPQGGLSGDVGNWTLSNHHFFDPISQTLFLGSGQELESSRSGFRVSTIAGTGAKVAAGDGGPALQASFIKPRGLIQKADGTLFVVDDCCTIRKIAPDGTITRFAGTGVSGYSGDGGPATQATFGQISHPVLLDDGTVVVADPPNHVIRAIDTSGIVRTIAGQPQQPGIPIDGQLASAAKINNPSAPMVASDGSIYFSDKGNSKLMRIDPSGILHTVAGTGVAGYSGDGGPALQAQLNDPAFCIEDAIGDIFIADRGNHIIRKLTPDGNISTFAGIPTVKGKPGLNDTLATARFNSLNDIALNAQGEFFIVDQGNDVIREITPDGHVIVAVGGGTSLGITGVLSGPMVSLSNPSNIVWDSVNGSLIVSDNGNSLIRKIDLAWPATASGYDIASQDGGEIFHFNFKGQHLSTRSSLTGQQLWSFAYDSSQRLISMADGYGAVTSISRDAGGEVSQITGPDGYVNQIQVSSNGMLSSVTLPMGERTQMDYAGGGLMNSYQKPLGQTDSYTFDSQGLLVTETNLGGGSKTFSPDGNGIQIVDSLGRMKHYQQYVNQNGGVSFEVIDSAGLVTTRSLNNQGQHSVVYPDGSALTSQDTFEPLTLTSQYTAAQSTSGFAGQAYVPTMSQTITGDLSGAFQIQSQSKGYTRTEQKTYDSLTRKLTSVSGLGETSVIQTDLFGNPVQIQKGNFTPVNLAYDSRGRLASLSQGSRQTSFSYNSKGELSLVIDPLNQSTAFGYDLAGRQTSITYQDGRVIKMGYNANSEVSSIETPLGALHQMAYNVLDLLSLYSAPIVGSSDGHLSYGYNSERQLISIARADGRTESFEYENQTGRLKSLGDANSATSLNYDGAGRVNQILSTSGVSISKTYKGSNLLSRTYSGPFSSSVSYAWLTKNLPASESINGSVINYSYSGDEQLSSVDSLVVIRDPSSAMITRIGLNQVSSTFGYSSYGELSGIRATFGSSPLYSEEFQRDALGRITSKTEIVGGTQSIFEYFYDFAGRLVQVKKNGQASSFYAYDKNGNRLSAELHGSTKSGVYDAHDRIVTYGTENYIFDGNGTLLSKQNPSESTTSRFFTDIFGQLSAVTAVSGSHIIYVTDGEKRRVQTEVNGNIEQRIIYGEGFRPVGMINSTNSLEHFGYGSKDNSPDLMIKDSVRYFFVKDHLGSIIMVINSLTGEISQHLEYDEFGNVLMDSNPGFQPFGFAGGLYDSNTRLVRFGARDYDSQLGRWTSRDPLLFDGQDTNLYLYASGDPINKSDPSGLQAVPIPFPISIPDSLVIPAEECGAIPDIPSSATLIPKRDCPGEYAADKAYCDRAWPPDSVGKHDCYAKAFNALLKCSGNGA